MKPLPGSGGPGFKSAGAAATAYAPPAPAAPAATTYAPPAAAAPAPVANAAASGSTWDSLAASKPMKPLPGSGGPGFKASSGFPAAAAAAAPVAAAPAPTQEVFAFSEAAPTSGSVWETLKQSKRMKVRLSCDFLSLLKHVPSSMFFLMCEFIFNLFYSLCLEALELDSKPPQLQIPTLLQLPLLLRLPLPLLPLPLLFLLFLVKDHLLPLEVSGPVLPPLSR